MKLAKNLSKLGTETAFKVLAEAKKLEKQGKKIIHLSLGQPDFNTPNHIVDATVKALKDGQYDVSVQAGAGIVADSSPENEYQETINKAKGILKALSCLDN